MTGDSFDRGSFDRPADFDRVDLDRRADFDRVDLDCRADFDFANLVELFPFPRSAAAPAPRN